MIAPETPKDDLFFVTALIRCEKAGDEWLGTGFFVRVPTTSGIDQLLLVTNRHVISDPDLGDADKIEFITPASDPGDSTRPLLGRSACAITPDAEFESHPSSEIDVAVANVTTLPTSGLDRYIKTIPAEMLYDEQLLNRLDALEQVTFIGYPKGLYDDVNMTPVARHGWTATPISLDYQGKPTFLIDASVFPGSSGSPVFALNSGPYQERLGAMHYGSPNMVLLGIVAEAYTFSETGTLVVGRRSKAFTVEQVLDLGIVFKGSAIIEAIDHNFSARGLTRKQPTGLPQGTYRRGPVDPP
jgi:V8-like Glu-specific endopeptidase